MPSAKFAYAAEICRRTNGLVKTITLQVDLEVARGTVRRHVPRAKLVGPGGLGRARRRALVSGLGFGLDDAGQSVGLVRALLDRLGQVQIPAAAQVAGAD